MNFKPRLLDNQSFLPTLVTILLVSILAIPWATLASPANSNNIGQLSPCSFVCGIYERECSDATGDGTLSFIDCFPSTTTEWAADNDGPTVRLACYKWQNIVTITYSAAMKTSPELLESEKELPVAHTIHPTLLERLAKDHRVSYLYVLVYLSSITPGWRPTNPNDWTTMLGGGVSNIAEPEIVYNVYRTKQIRANAEFGAWQNDEVFAGLVSVPNPHLLSKVNITAVIKNPLMRISVCQRYHQACPQGRAQAECPRDRCRCKSSYVAVEQSDNQRRGWTFYHETEDINPCMLHTAQQCTFEYTKIMLNATLEDNLDNIQRLPKGIKMPLVSEQNASVPSVCRLTNAELESQTRLFDANSETSLVTPLQARRVPDYSRDDGPDDDEAATATEQRHLPDAITRRLCAERQTPLSIESSAVATRQQIIVLSAVLCFVSLLINTPAG